MIFFHVAFLIHYYLKLFVKNTYKFILYVQINYDLDIAFLFHRALVLM